MGDVQEGFFLSSDGANPTTLIVISPAKATETRDQFLEWAVNEGYGVISVLDEGRKLLPWPTRCIHRGLFVLADIAQGDWAWRHSGSGDRKRITYASSPKALSISEAETLIECEQPTAQTGRRFLMVSLGSDQSALMGRPIGAIPCVGLDFVGWGGDDLLVCRRQVFERQPYVDFLLWERKPRRQSNLLLHARYQTRRTVSASASVLRSKGLEQLKRVITNLASGIEAVGSGDRAAGVLTQVEQQPRPTMATSLTWLSSSARGAITLLKERMHPRGRHIWHVEVAQFSRDGSLDNVVVVPNPEGGWLADPHLHRVGDRNFLFVEEFRTELGRARISLLDLSNLEGSSPIPILEEPFHLSFPWVFEYENRLYMSVESSQAEELRIYRAQDFPLTWVHETSQFVGTKVADAMIVELGGQWFLLANMDTTLDSERNSELHVFTAEDPISGVWRPLRGNPQVIDSLRARNGGWLNLAGKSYRVGQRQGYLRYGEGCSLLQVESMSPEGYREVPARDSDIGDLRGLLKANRSKWGPHTVTVAGAQIAYDLAVAPRRSVRPDRR